MGNDLWSALRRAALVLAAVTVAATIAAAVLSSTRTPEYEASALLQVVSGRQAGGDFVSQDELLHLTNVIARQARTTAVSDLARQQNPQLSAGELQSIQITTEPDVEVLRLTATDPSPKRAAERANAYAAAVVAYEQNQQNAERNADVARLQDRITELKPTPSRVTTDTTPDAELQALQTKLADRLARTDDDVRPLEAATPPAAPSSPKPLRDGVLAGVAVLCVGLLVVYARSAISSRFATAADVSRALELPSLGEIPRGRSAAAMEEAFRVLRTSLDFGIRSSDRPVIVVTSAEPRSGKTYVVANLGRAFAAEGRRVVLVDSDVRRPTLHDRLGVRLEPGLGELLSADRPGASELQIAQVPAGASQRGGDLDVVTAGGGVPDPAEALASLRMEHAVATLRDAYDVAILDSPPLLGVADALVLSRYATAVVLVVDSRRDRVRSTRRAVEMLRSVDAPVLGFVFNGGKGGDRVYGAYGNRGSLQSTPPSAAAGS